jgi:hypothetical protein
MLVPKYGLKREAESPRPTCLDRASSFALSAPARPLFLAPTGAGIMSETSGTIIAPQQFSVLLQLPSKKQKQIACTTIPANLRISEMIRHRRHS